MAAEDRRQTTQPIAWFWDLKKRELLELNPPYQRRSVWTQSYKDYFIDTVLLNYPAPAVFLFEDISDQGVGRYSVVDGKQRLTTVFEFLADDFAVGEDASVSRLRGLYFSDFSSEDKRRFYSYQFSIEFLPTLDENTLNNIFDRINRNVARLTQQELRHAKYSGVFASAAENLSEEMLVKLQKDFPRIAPRSRRQMKDVEFAAQLLLLTERGVESQSQEGLDIAYAGRDDDWEESVAVQDDFRAVISVMARWGEGIVSTEARRLRNQADFYSLYGAILDLKRMDRLPDDSTALARLTEFMAKVVDEQGRQGSVQAKRYYEAARSASNDLAQRRNRIDILRDVLSEEYEDASA